MKVCYQSIHATASQQNLLSFGESPRTIARKCRLERVHNPAELGETKRPSLAPFRCPWKSRFQLSSTRFIVIAQSYSRRSLVDSIPMLINSTGLTLTLPHPKIKRKLLLLPSPRPLTLDTLTFRVYLCLVDLIQELSQLMNIHGAHISPEPTSHSKSDNHDNYKHHAPQEA